MVRRKLTRNDSLVVLVEPENKSHIMSAGINEENIVVMDRCKLGLLGQSAAFPGFSTLLTNLVASVSSRDSDSSVPWHEEYSHGLEQEIYAFRIPPRYSGKTFKEVALVRLGPASIPTTIRDVFIQEIYADYQAAFFGVGQTLIDKDGKSQLRVQLNPHAIRLTPKHLGFLIAEDSSIADAICGKESLTNLKLYRLVGKRIRRCCKRRTNGAVSVASHEDHSHLQGLKGGMRPTMGGVNREMPRLHLPPIAMPREGRRASGSLIKPRPSLLPSARRNSSGIPSACPTEVTAPQRWAGQDESKIATTRPRGETSDTNLSSKTNSSRIPGFELKETELGKLMQFPGGGSSGETPRTEESDPESPVPPGAVFPTNDPSTNESHIESTDSQRSRGRSRGQSSVSGRKLLSGTPPRPQSKFVRGQVNESRIKLIHQLVRGSLY